MDLHSFVNANDQFVLKQFSMMSIHDEEAKSYNFTVKAPCSWEDLTPKARYFNSSRTREVHRLTWDSGTVTYKAAMKRIHRLLRDAKTVCVRGSKNKKWLSRFLSPTTTIIDLKKLHCPEAITLHRDYSGNIKYRLGHTGPSKIFLSTSQNVKLLKRWILENKVIPKPKTDSILDKCIECLKNFAISHFQLMIRDTSSKKLMKITLKERNLVEFKPQKH